jgi:hypothetical protein
MKNLFANTDFTILGATGRNTVLFLELLDFDLKNGLRSFRRIDGWAMSSDRKMLSKA